MRIAVFHNAPSGGAKRAIYEWVRRLAPDHEIDVYSLSTAEHAFSDIRPYAHRNVVFDFAPHRLFKRPFGRLNQLQRWRDLKELTTLGREIANRIDEDRSDVVFAHNCRFTFIPGFLQFLHTPSVYYLHEPFGSRVAHTIERPYFKNNPWRKTIDRFDPLIGLYYRQLELMQRKSIGNTSLLLANSKFTQEQMKIAFGVDAPICHVGVDTEIFCPVPDTRKERMVISVGELSPRKGFDFVVASLGRVPAAERPKLILACNRVDASEEIYVRSIADRYGVDLKVLSNLTKEELAVQYSRALFCIYAPVLEPFGLVPLEAMACGIPVIGVREAGVKESVIHERTGLLIERSLEEFADAIQCLVSGPDLREEYGRKGREHVLQNWTWDQSVAGLAEHLAGCARRLS